jgi:hypothetical protein
LRWAATGQENLRKQTAIFLALSQIDRREFVKSEMLSWTPSPLKSSEKLISHRNINKK